MKKKFSCIISLVFLFSFYSKVHAQVLINEFSSFESSGDWVELHASETTNISGWILRDAATTVMTQIPDGTSIGSSDFYVVDVGNRLNKDGDTIKLFKSDDQTKVDEIDYGGSNEVCTPGSGQTVGRFENGNTIDRFSTGTKGATNTGATLSPCPSPTPTPPPTASSTPAPFPTLIPTKSPTPSPIPTIKPTPFPTATPDTLATSDQNNHQADVLGLRDSLAPTDTPKSSTSDNKSNFPLVAGALVLAGIGLIGVAGFMAYKKQKETSSDTING